MPIEKLPCGCKHNGTAWLSECPQHKAENDAIHERWGRETLGQPVKESNPWE